MNEELIRQCVADSIDPRDYLDEGDYRTAREDVEYAIRLYHARLMTPKPISEAPTGNGSKPFLAYITGHGWAAAWKSESGRFFSSCGKMIELRQPTHFLPMPPAPFQQEGASDPAPQQPITPEVRALVEAAENLMDLADGFSASGVYFSEPCMTENVEALAAVRMALAAFGKGEE